MAPPTVSAKLGLTIDPDGESPVGNNSANWDLVDDAAGTKIIPNAGSPTNPYDGAIVTEYGTGKSWILVPDGSGGFLKKYLNYPYIYCASTPTTGCATQAAFVVWSWTTISAASSYNHNASDKDAGTNGWIAPIKGLYSVSANYVWPTTVTDKVKASILAINNVNQTQTECRKYTGASGVTNSSKGLFNLNAGDIVTGKIVNTAGTENLYTSVYVTLVRPLP